jgi:hypothetical protein
MYNAYCLTRKRSCIIRKIEEGMAMSKKMKRSAEEESSSSKHSTRYVRLSEITIYLGLDFRSARFKSRNDSCLVGTEQLN